MADTVRSQLEQAYRLIQDERLDEANNILRPILAADRNNADAWWLFANAVTEPDDAREALDNVLRLDPKHAQARDLLAKLDEVSVPSVGRGGDILAAASTVSSADFDNLDDFFGNAPLDADLAEPAFLGGTAKPGTSAASERRAPRSAPSQPMARRRSTPPSALLLIAAVVIVVIVAGVFLLVIQRNNVAAPGTLLAVPTLVVNAPTPLSPTTVTTVVPSAATEAASQVGTPAATVSSAADTLGAAVQAAAVQFQASGYADAKAALSTSSLGQTLTVTLCSAVGPKFPAAVDRARDLLATQAASASGALAAIGVTVTNCADSSKVLYKGVAAIADVTSFVNKATTAAQFHKLWKTG